MLHTYIKDIKTAISTCLTHFFSGQQTRTINGADIDFYDCDIKFGKEKLADTFSGKPLIVIFSPTEKDKRVFKSDEQFLHELYLDSRVVVKVSTTTPQVNLSGNIISSRELAHSVWGQLSLVINTQEDRFESYGIRHINIDSSPDEIDDEDSQEVILTEIFSYEYQLLASHDKFVAP